jgi:thiamine monophosphate synthase
MSVHSIVPDLEAARRAAGAGANVLRLAAGRSTAATIAAGRGMRQLGTPFYVVDDLDAALELGADGLSLERRPERGEAARALGLSIGGPAAVLDGLTADAAYLEAVRVKRRGRSEGAWLAELSSLCADAPAPIIVRRAIDPERAAACIAAGAAGIAVAGPPADRQLRAAVDRALAARAAERRARRWYLLRQR